MAPHDERLLDDGIWDLAESDARTLRERLGEFGAAVVLGSGWAAVGTSLGTPVADMALEDLAGVPAPTVVGHGGAATSVDLGGPRVLVLAGRSHLYEGHSPHTVVHAVRAAVLAGCATVLLTNAAGSLRPEVGIGTPVVLSDQLNLTATSPLAGPAPPERHGSRFTDLSDLYSPRLRAAALAAEPAAVEGVYAGVFGGSFETPAEIRMLAGLGADLVGMSTVLEAIAARHLGAEVFGVSLVTNLAAGLQPALSHTEVLEAGAAAADRLSALLRAVLVEALGA
jgi:purine-nucleoside phosphorylase